MVDYVNVRPLCSNYPRSGPALFCIQRIQKIPEIGKPQFFSRRKTKLEMYFPSILLLGVDGVDRPKEMVRVGDVEK